MKPDASMKEATERYLALKEKIRQQEADNNDLDDFCGVDEQLLEQLGFAKELVQQCISPDEYFCLKGKAKHLSNEIGALIMENLVLKNEVRRLGGNPEMLGNIDSEGAA
jgi:hypothetical protein